MGQIPVDLVPALESEFTEFELFEIGHRCDLYTAPRSNSTPKALWVFGPPAVGKTFTTNEKTSNLFGELGTCVTIDGDIFRSVHKGFQMVTLHGSRNGLVHKDAWIILKKSGQMDKIKDALLDRAVQCRQHLQIPEAATSTKRIKGMLQRLERAGYEMHAICLWAPKSVTEARGRPRSGKAGKAFSVDLYQGSTQNTLYFGQLWEEQIKKGNVHYKSVEYYDNTTFPSHRVNVREFEQFTNMTDDEATEHARYCEIAKQARDVSEKAASEARENHTVLGGRISSILRAKSQALQESGMNKEGNVGLPISHTSRLGTDVTVCLAELRRSWWQGFLAGCIFGAFAMFIFKSLRQAGRNGEL